MGDEVSVQVMELCGLGMAIRATAGQMLEACCAHSYLAIEGLGLS